MPYVQVQWLGHDEDENTANVDNDAIDWVNSDRSGNYNTWGELIAAIDRANPCRPRRARIRHDDGTYGSWFRAWHRGDADRPPQYQSMSFDALEPPAYLDNENSITKEGISMSEPAPNSLVDIRIARNEVGKLVLAINARALHNLLDSVGCKAGGEAYADGPSAAFSTISQNKMSTRLLLLKQYPVQVALGHHYSRPPSYAELKELCESAHAAVRAILMHYQPVDIHYTIHKLVK
jgi:hypothetical protein